MNDMVELCPKLLMTAFYNYIFWFCCFRSYYLEHFAIDPTCIDHYTWTVSEMTKDNAVSFGLRDMTKRFRDCLGR